MVSHGERRFDETDVTVLKDYAARMDGRLRAELGEPASATHTQTVRTIADKIQADIDGQHPTFSVSDADAIWNVGAALERNADLFAKPDVAADLQAQAPLHRARAAHLRDIAELVRDRAGKTGSPRDRRTAL